VFVYSTTSCGTPNDVLQNPGLAGHESQVRFPAFRMWTTSEIAQQRRIRCRREVHVEIS